MNIQIRTAESDEYNFVISNWLKNYQQYSNFAKRIPRDVFFKNHEQIIKKVLSRTGSAVAIDPTEDLLLGFMCWEYTEDDIPVIHYIFIKEAFRKFGIANKIIQKYELDLNNAMFTHWTKDCDWMVGTYKVKGKYPKLVYNPYLIGG